MMEDLRNFNAAKLKKIVEEELDSGNKRIQTRIGGLKEFDSSNVKHVTDFYSVIEEELNWAKKKIQTRVMRLEKDADHDPLADKQLKLEFRGKISEKILTGEEIKGERGVLIEVALVDASTRKLEEIGPQANLEVEILLLKGSHDVSEGDDWTAEEFERNAVQDTKGKKSLLSGSTRVKLQRGVGKMKGIKFIHRASEWKPPVFCLGARIADAVGTVARDRVKEGRTNPFTLEIYRKKYFQKNETPYWTGGVSQLVNVYKGGEHEGRLRDHKIFTVGEFLIELLRDPKRLQSLVLMMVGKKWRDTVDNARACRDKRMFCYKKMIVFDVFGEVRRFYSKNQWTLADTFSINQKVEAEELLITARKTWEDVEEFIDHENYLGESSSGILNSVTSEFTGESSSRLNGEDVDEEFVEENSPGEHSSGLLNRTTSELIGETSSRPNLLNSGTQTGSNTFCIDDVPMYVPVFQHIPGSSPEPQNLCGITAEMNESWRHWHSQKKWRKFVHVSGWSFFIKKIALRGRNHKKRKAH